MKISTLARHAREGFRNLSRNGWMTFASISCVTITLLLLGVFLILAYNVQQVSHQIEDQVEMNVIVKENTDRAQVLELERQIKSLPAVGDVKYISKEDGLKQMRDKLQDKKALLDGLETENPLPDKFIVKAKNATETSSVADKIGKLPVVKEVNFAKDTVEKLFTVTKFVRNAGGVFVVGLSFIALFLISNTIKVTIFARRREIEIMKLVGATNWFIRWPFLVEGLLIGVLGASLPVLGLGIGYDYVVRTFSGVLLFTFAPADPLVYSIGGMLLGIGALIGMIGSVMSISRFLRV
jgi:cell division transport system permease protein